MLPGETPIASLAGAGTSLLEFTALSLLTGDRSFRDLAYQTAINLFDRRSSLGLLGKHVNTTSGEWTEQSSGIGANR
jgi:hypothetical protein